MSVGCDNSRGQKLNLAMERQITAFPKAYPGERSIRSGQTSMAPSLGESGSSIIVPRLQQWTA